MRRSSPFKKILFWKILESTNGLEVNGSATKKHFLQDNDLIEIGKCNLKYVNDQVSQTTADDFEKTMILRVPLVKPVEQPALSGETSDSVERINPDVPQNDVKQAVSEDKTGQFESSAFAKSMIKEPVSPFAPVKPTQPVAVVQILSGPNAGRELELVKSLTTLGKPGVQVAVLTRRPHGFFMTHVEGAHHPTVNGEALGDQPHPLQDHDIIDLAGIKMEFYLKE
jgi:pSer/pThr/pTyr-binding forkhead associated (FHA) protein